MSGFVGTWLKINIREFLTFVCLLLLKCCVCLTNDRSQTDVANRPFHGFFFSTFDTDKLRKISQLQRPLPRLKLICWKLKKTSFSNSRNFTEVCRVGASLCPHHTNYCKISQLFGATVILSRLRRIPFKLDNCTNFKALFSLVSTDFP